MAFPSPPWTLQGDLWLSVFRATHPRVGRGTFGVAFVAYGPASTLSYSELAVARMLTPDPTPAIEVTDIWVNSVTSREAGRSLWALPKELAEFEPEEAGIGVAAEASWSARTEQGPIAEATFRDVTRVLPRVPLMGATRQRRSDGAEVHTSFSGSGKVWPCLGTWMFAADGPLSWLIGARSLTSFRVAGFDVSFG